VHFPRQDAWPGSLQAVVAARHLQRNMSERVPAGQNNQRGEGEIAAIKLEHTEPNPVGADFEGLPNDAVDEFDTDQARPIQKNGAWFSPWEQNILTEIGMDVSTYNSQVQKRVDWQDFFEDPQSSSMAYAFSTMVMMCIVISTVTLCLETLPVYDNDDSKRDLFIVETFCICIFTFEYVTRVTLAYNRLQFVVQAMNIIDLIAIVPYFVTLLIMVATEASADELSSLGVLRLFRLARVFRILKLARNMPTLRLIIMAVVESVSSLTLMVFILIMMLIVFGAFVYFFEFQLGDDEYCSDSSISDELLCVGLDANNNTRVWYNSPWDRKRCDSGWQPNYPSDIDNCSITPFISIPQAMWWCLVTLLTVGYGDIYPITIGGKIVAALAMVSSVTILALPISIIGTNFVEFWAAEEEHASRKEDPVALTRSANVVRQSLDLFVQTIKYNIEKSDALKRTVLRLMSDIGTQTQEERIGRPSPARQQAIYQLKAAEQLLYVLRTKNLRLVPLNDAETMRVEATQLVSKLDSGSTPRENSNDVDDGASRLTHQGEMLLMTWQANRPPASLLKVLDRSLGNARWFRTMLEEHNALRTELAAMRRVLQIQPGQFLPETEEVPARP